MRFTQAHLSSLSRSLWMAPRPSGVSTVALNLVSSADLLRVHSMSLSKSLINILNSNIYIYISRSCPAVQWLPAPPVYCPCCVHWCRCTLSWAVDLTPHTGMPRLGSSLVRWAMSPSPFESSLHYKLMVIVTLITFYLNVWCVLWVFFPTDSSLLLRTKPKMTFFHRGVTWFWGGGRCHLHPSRI